MAVKLFICEGTMNSSVANIHLYLFHCSFIFYYFYLFGKFFRSLICNLRLQAYAEEEGRREAVEKKRNEAQALSRWYQLLSSIITRQRLNNRYGHSSFFEPQSATQRTKNNPIMRVGETNAQLIEKQKEDASNLKSDALSAAPWEHHEHVFLAEDQTFHEESSTRTKRCPCGFSVQVEEL